MRNSWRWSWRLRGFIVTVGQQKGRICEHLVPEHLFFQKHPGLLTLPLKLKPANWKEFVPKKTQQPHPWSVPGDHFWLGNAFFTVNKFMAVLGRAKRGSWVCWVLSASFLPAVDKIPAPAATWGWILQRQNISIKEILTWNPPFSCS